MKVVVTWEIEDGFVCGERSRKLTLNFTDEEWKDMDAGEKDDVIGDLVQEDFAQRVSWRIKKIEEIT
jgi:hypothetical protein